LIVLVGGEEVWDITVYSEAKEVLSKNLAEITFEAARLTFNSSMPISARVAERSSARLGVASTDGRWKMHKIKTGCSG